MSEGRGMNFGYLSTFPVVHQNNLCRRYLHMNWPMTESSSFLYKSAHLHIAIQQVYKDQTKAINSKSIRKTGTINFPGFECK